MKLPFRFRGARRRHLDRGGAALAESCVKIEEGRGSGSESGSSSGAGAASGRGCGGGSPARRGAAAVLRPTLLLELLQLKLVMELFARGGEAVEVHVPARCVTVAHTLTLTHSQAHNGC